jgi:hypothetical protein
VLFDEGQLPGQDPSWIAAEVGDVGHRHLGTRITQLAAQRCQSVPWNRDQDGLPQLQAVADELHQPVHVFALRVVQERCMVVAPTVHVCSQCHVD